MIDFRNTEGVFFVGIGGIGMSALALYFRKGGYTVAGYDRTSSAVSESLASQGCSIIYHDDPHLLPELFSDAVTR
ncbi:MAG: Mur ligase domain-containing protein, partial [Bacteroidales bacterium]|nr:Mur ligase domain-containing protein [Bacteroidales bacterium]